MSKIGITEQNTLSQTEALRLYDLGLNVFPQPVGQKSGYPWRELQYMRLARNHASFGLTAVTIEANLAVMCGHTSGNLFVIDCESEDSLLFHIQQMVIRNIPIWLVKTARGGHLYVRSVLGEVDNVPSGVMLDCEIRGRNSYVLAPPSLHPSGIRYHWVITQGDTIPLIDPKRIDWLTDKQGNSVVLLTRFSAFARKRHFSITQGKPVVNLSKATQFFLSQGGITPKGSRNMALFRASCDFAGNGLSRLDAESQLVPIAMSSGLSYQESIKTVHSAYSQPRTPSRPNLITQRETSISLRWQYAMAYAVRLDWSGRSGSNYRAVLLALLERCRLSENDRGTFRASIREIAELARVSINTVQRALKTFRSTKGTYGGLLQYQGGDHMSNASLWRFTDEVLAEGKAQLLEVGAEETRLLWLEYSSSLFESDAVERGALGKTAMFLYHVMRTEKKRLMPSKWAEISKMSVNQVNYALSKMKEFGLILRDSQGWYAIDCSMEEATEQVLLQKPSCRGRYERRAERFRKQREEYVSRLTFYNRLRWEGESFLELVMTKGRQIRGDTDEPISLVAGMVSNDSEIVAFRAHLGLL